MNLWKVFQRTPLQPRDRKVWIFTFLTIADSKEQAIDNVRGKRGTQNSSWDAKISQGDVVSVGCYSDTPTAEEIAVRARRNGRVGR